MEDTVSKALRLWSFSRVNAGVFTTQCRHPAVRLQREAGRESARSVLSLGDVADVCWIKFCSSASSRKD